MTCEELRDVAVELALDELTGAERADALAHLSSCDACRALVADLSVVADAVLLVAPSVEPPAGFESKVLSQLGRTRSPRRWRVAAIAAAAAIVVGLGAGFLVGARGDGREYPLAATLTGSAGGDAGTVVLDTHPDRMTCVFEDEHFGGAYDVQLVLDDGSTRDVGTFTADRSPWSWTVPLPVDADDVRTVQVRSADGVVRAEADLA